MATGNVQLSAGSGTFISTNTVSRDGQTENMEVVNLGDPSTATCASVTAAGTSGTNAIAVQGVSGAYPQTVTVGGNTPVITQLASATASTPQYVKNTGGRVGRLVYTGTSAAAATIVIIDQSSGAANTSNIIYQAQNMAAGQIIDLQLPVTNGIGIYLSTGSLSSNIVLTWS